MPVLRDRDTDANGTLDERLWAQEDANWDTTALVNGSGVVIERYAYDPFGSATVYDASYTVRTGGSSYAAVYLFQGGRQDAVTGSYNFQRRDEDPTTGAWRTPDPKGLTAGDQNLYRFVGNGPLSATDPSGLSRLSDAWDNFTDSVERVYDRGKRDLKHWAKRTETRIVGGVQFVAGAVATAGGVSTVFLSPTMTPAATLGGIVIMAAGIDLVYHGAHKAWYAEEAPTWINQGVTQSTGSGTAGDVAEFIESLLAPGSGLRHLQRYRQILRMQREYNQLTGRNQFLRHLQREAVESGDPHVVADIEREIQQNEARRREINAIIYAP